MPILNYRTQIAADKTLQEISQLLSSKGANKIIVDYEEGTPSAISFIVQITAGPLHFRLPANWQAVQKVLVNQRVAKSYQTEKHAKNVCWRIIKDWIAAQMAIIEAEQADLATVFLPYAVMKNGETVANNLLGDQAGTLLIEN